jgi:hypothetical protein
MTQESGTTRLTLAVTQRDHRQGPENTLMTLGQWDTHDASYELETLLAAIEAAMP